jgi:hypothetical protein
MAQMPHTAKISNAMLDFFQVQGGNLSKTNRPGPNSNLVCTFW